MSGFDLSGQTILVTGAAGGIGAVTAQVLAGLGAKLVLTDRISCATTIAGLTGFGLPLGEAFQLRDDLLGVFGDPEVTGKPAGDDLVEGKRTVLIAHALDGLGGADRDLLDASLGRPLSTDEVARLRGLIDASGAHARVEELITSLTTQALDALDALDVRDEARAVLRRLAAAATQRTV